MTFPTNTIRLEAARAIFNGVEFEEIVVGGEVCAYRAVIRSSGARFENKALTRVCAELWRACNGGRSPEPCAENHKTECCHPTASSG